MKKMQKIFSMANQKLSHEEQHAVKGGGNPGQVELDFTYLSDGVVVWSNGHMVYLDLGSADFLDDLDNL